MTFYEQTDGENWIIKDGWSEGVAGTSCDPCVDMWHGVYCFPNGSIIDINLDNNNLTGEIGREIFDIEGLRTLNLNDNNLSGELPDTLELIENFTLTLSKNNFSGPLPRTIFDNNFRELDLSNNQFSGEIPDGAFAYSMITLDLSNNQLTGNLPVSPTFSELYEIDLSLNQLTGPLPATIFHDSLHRINFSGNQFTGTIPPEVFLNNKFITFVDLSQNNLTGPIPSTIEDLNFIQVIDLSHNQLEGVINFNSLNGTNSLDTLDFSYNRLSGTIPDYTSGIGIIKSIQLNNNNFEGCVPSNLLNTYCGSSALSLNVSENPKLAHSGETVGICNGGNIDDQIGAPCDNDGQINTIETIQLDCSCGESFTPDYLSDTLMISQDGLNHQLIIHQIFDDSIHINVINLFENETDLFFTGNNGIYKRIDGQISLEELNPIGMVSYYLYPATKWSNSADYARLLLTKNNQDEYRFNLREFESGPGNPGGIYPTSLEMKNFLLSHETSKTFQYGPISASGFVFGDFFTEDSSLLVYSEGNKSISNKFFYNSQYTSTSETHFASSLTEISHPLNNLEQLRTRFSGKDIDWTILESPQLISDAIFVNDSSIMISPPASATAKIYDLNSDIISDLTWTNQDWPIKLEVINDTPIFLLENNGLLLGYEDQSQIDLHFIMEEANSFGVNARYTDIYVDLENNIWLHFNDLETNEAILEIKLDTSLTAVDPIISSTAEINQTAIELYPNPSADIINITFEEKIQTDIVTYKIHNLIGTCLAQNELFDSRIEISNLPAGIYYLELQAGELRWIEKFIVAD